MNFLQYLLLASHAGMMINFLRRLRANDEYGVTISTIFDLWSHLRNTLVAISLKITYEFSPILVKFASCISAFTKHITEMELIEKKWRPIGA